MSPGILELFFLSEIFHEYFQDNWGEIRVTGILNASPRPLLNPLTLPTHFGTCFKVHIIS